MKAHLLLILGSVAAIAQDHAHHNSPIQSDDAQIVISINPEARVSAVLGATLPAPSVCGSAIDLKIKVINQGYITAPLRASIVGDDLSRIALNMAGAKLSGKAEESRTLHLVPLGPSPVDVTIAFSVEKSVGDLGGRDRVHFVVHCSAIPAG